MTGSRLLSLALLLFVTSFSETAAAANLNATWNGGLGSWSTAAEWSGGVVPNNSGGNDFNVSIDGGNPIASTVTLDSNATVSKLAIDSGDELDQVNGTTLAIAGGPAVNNGLWKLNTSGAPTDIRFFDGVTLSGTGSIVMNDALFLANRILTDSSWSPVDLHDRFDKRKSSTSEFMTSI